MSAKDTGSKTCEGCGAAFPNRTYGGLDFAEVRVGEKREARLCKHRDRPKKSCLRAFREREITCGACGEPGDYSLQLGDICIDCQKIFRRAKEAEAGSAVKWYAIDQSQIFSGHFLRRDGDNEALLKECAELLARAVKGPRRFERGLPSDGDRFFSVSGVIGAGRKEADTGMISVEMDEEQAAALQTLVGKIAAIGDAIYRAGFKEGDSLLRRLASGDTKPDDYEQWRSREMPKKGEE